MLFAGTEVPVPGVGGRERQPVTCVHLNGETFNHGNPQSAIRNPQSNPASARIASLTPNPE